MATIVTRSGKGSALTHTEMDANFNNLNGAKVETSAIGTAAASDVTTSRIDTTPDRLLKVGDFGIGGRAFMSFEDDLNNWDSGGAIQTGSTTTNKPGTDTYAVWCMHNNNNGARVSQMAFGQSNDRIFTRSYTGASWTSWKEIYHTGNTVGTVSQSAGVPTGAIIERGSNSNGEYVKYADGTLICRFISTTNTPINTGSGSVFVSAGVNLTFPATFIFDPQVSDASVRAGASRIWGAIFGVSGSIVNIYGFSTLTDSAGIYFGYTAIGRWY